MQYQDNQFKWVVVINRKCAMARILNALGHLALGMPSLIDSEAAKLFHPYEGSDAKHIGHLSHWPVIVLQANNSSQLRVLRTAAMTANLPCQSFVESMIGQSAEQQIQATRTTDLEKQEFVAVMLFGESDKELRPLTKRFSLFAADASARLVTEQTPIGISS